MDQKIKWLSKYKERQHINMEREGIHRSNDPKEGIKIMLEWKTKNTNCKQVRFLSNQ